MDAISGEAVFNSLVTKRAEMKNDFFFIQIGAGNGIDLDPIRHYILRYQWHGILIEPIKYLFDQLIENYRESKNLVFENVAIDNKPGVRKLYRLEEDVVKLGLDLKYIGSFNIDHILKYRERCPNIEEKLIIEHVPCITYDTLLHKHNIQAIDLLQIDTEGYDYEILTMALRSPIKPAMIHFEYIHVNRSDKTKALQLLDREKYKTIACGIDAFAYIEDDNHPRITRA